MLELWLIRHGESVDNVDGSQGDTGLSECGRSQARGIAPELAKVSFDTVWSSPLRRAKETTELALPGQRYMTEERLRELVVPPAVFLDVAAMSAQELLALAQAPAGDAHVAETGLEFIARLSSWLESLPDTGRIAAFSHFAVIRECLRLRSASTVPQHIEHCEVRVIALR